MANTPLYSTASHEMGWTAAQSCPTSAGSETISKPAVPTHMVAAVTGTTPYRCTRGPGRGRHQHRQVPRQGRRAEAHARRSAEHDECDSQHRQADPCRDDQAAAFLAEDQREQRGEDGSGRQHQTRVAGQGPIDAIDEERLVNRRADDTQPDHRQPVKPLDPHAVAARLEEHPQNAGREKEAQ
jgi:hypothetical protein